VDACLSVIGTPFFVFAKPRQSYTVKFQAGTEAIDTTIQCDLIDAELKRQTK